MSLFALQLDITQFGIGQENLFTLSDDVKRVEVHEINSCLSDQQMEELRQVIDPLSYSSCHGMDIFESTLNFMTRGHDGSVTHRGST